MNNWYGIILTSAFTIIGGVIIIILGKFAVHFFFEPTRKLNKSKEEICKVLSFNRNKYLNPGMVRKEELLKISEEIRKLATELLSIRNMLKGNKFFSMLNSSIKDENILEAQKSLFSLSNNIGKNLSKGEKKIICSYENDIEKALNIKFT